MNGAHDMGGMHGFGPVEPRVNEETFHAEWEKRVPGLTSVVSRTGTNTDQMRYGIERMAPAHYLAASYYERHLFSAELNLVERGVLTTDEIEARVELLRADPSASVRRVDPALAEATIRARLESRLPPAPDAAGARFHVGDRVVARNVHVRGHTRLPRYVRGKRGVIHLFHDVETLPDANAHGRPPSPEPVYSVRFDSRELWGASADGPGSVFIDLWESYLEPFQEEDSAS